jgi:hypothetical protein
MEWIFDGIGTSIIMFILGLVIGAPAGYKIGVNRAKINQKQKAGNSSTQTQVGQININNGQE